jgi:hypothetical protein
MHSDAPTQTTFEKVLTDPDAFPIEHTLYLKEGDGWRLDQSALVIDPDEGEDKESTVGALVALDQWQYILEMAAIRSIVDNLMSQKPSSNVQDRLAAFVYYFEHDAFLPDVPFQQGRASQVSRAN